MIEKIVKATHGSNEDVVKLESPIGCFNLWCCDCDLRHEVWVEARKSKILVYLFPDWKATRLARKARRLEKKLKKIKC